MMSQPCLLFYAKYLQKRSRAGRIKNLIIIRLHIIYCNLFYQENFKIFKTILVYAKNTLIELC